MNKGEGIVYSCGSNTYGQVGDPNRSNLFTPLPINMNGRAVSIAVGAESSYILLDDGSVWSFGRNQFGQLGIGSTVSATTPVRVPNLSDIIGIIAGTHHSFLIRCNKFFSFFFENE